MSSELSDTQVLGLHLLPGDALGQIIKRLWVEDIERLAGEHEQRMLVLKRSTADRVKKEHSELGTMLDTVLLSSDLLLQTIAHAQSLALQSLAHAMLAQELQRQMALHEHCGDADALLRDQV